MSQSYSPAMLDVLDPGWRDRQAARDQAFAEFFATLPPRGAHVGIALIANKDHTDVTVEPIAVVDFYPEGGRAPQ